MRAFRWHLRREREDRELQRLLAEVRKLEAQALGLATGPLAGAWRSLFRGAGLEAEDVREYVPGDDPRRLDPFVSARLGRPYVRTYTEERRIDVVFLLDLSQRLERGLGPWTLAETGVRVVACLALGAVAQRDRVGLVAYAERPLVVLPPRSGPQAVLRVLREVLSRRGGGAQSAPDAALRLADALCKRRALVFWISDHLAPADPRRVLPLIRRHDVLAVRLLAREEVDPPRALVRLRDAWEGRIALLDGADARHRRAFLEGARARREAAFAPLAVLGLRVVDLAVPREPDVLRLLEPLRRHLVRWRGRR